MRLNLGRESICVNEFCEQELDAALICAHHACMITHPAAGWRIRQYEHADAPRCRRIFERAVAEFAWRGSSEQYLPALAESLRGELSWVAEERNAGVVGFLTMLRYKPYVDHLFVEADWRFCGVGRGLLHVARAAANRPLELHVDRKNVHARRAYAAMGWEEIGKRTKHGNIRLRSI